MSDMMMGHTNADAEALALALESGRNLVWTIRDGAWSDPAVWNLGITPRFGQVAVVLHETTYDAFNGQVVPTGANLYAVINRGCLMHSGSKDTRLVCGTFLNMPGACHEVMPAAGRIAELVLGGWPLDLALDPTAIAPGYASWGDVDWGGEPRVPFLELANDVNPGDQDLYPVTMPPDWRPGDQLALPVVGVPGEEAAGDLVEYATVASLEDDERIHLTASLHCRHWRGRDAKTGVDLPIHVANLTRSVRVRSLDPNGVRGHTMFTGWCKPVLKNVSFANLGRTTMDPNSQLGRYGGPHFHMLQWTVPDPAVRFILEGCVVQAPDNAKWGGAVVHSSHRGRITGLVTVGGDHSGGVIFEFGDESANVVDGVLAMGVKSGHGGWWNSVNNEIRNYHSASCWTKPYPEGLVQSHVGNPPRPVSDPIAGNETMGWGPWVTTNYDVYTTYTTPKADGLSTETWQRGFRGLGEVYPVENITGYGLNQGALYIDHRWGDHKVKGLKAHACYGTVTGRSVGCVATYNTHSSHYIDPQAVECALGINSDEDVTIVRPRAAVESYGNNGILTVDFRAEGSEATAAGMGPVHIFFKFPSQPGATLIPTILKELDVIEPPDGWTLQLHYLGLDGQASRCPVEPIRVRVRLGKIWWRVWFNEQAADAITPGVNEFIYAPGSARCGAPQSGKTNAQWRQTCWRPSAADPGEPEFAAMGEPPPEGWLRVAVGGEVMPPDAVSVPWLTGGKAAKEQP